MNGQWGMSPAEAAALNTGHERLAHSKDGLLKVVYAMQTPNGLPSVMNSIVTTC